MGDIQPLTPTSDSMVSGHDHFQETSPPDPMGHSHPIPRPQSSLGHYNGGGSVGSAPGSTVSLGSPPPVRDHASEPAGGNLGPFSPPPARDQLISALPPRSNFLRPSESLQRHLGRTESANHAQEMEALHQVDLYLRTLSKSFHYQHARIMMSAIKVENQDCIRHEIFRLNGS